MKTVTGYKAVLIAAGIALMLGAVGLGEAAPGVITAKVAPCAPGFKQVNKDKKGNYVCVSARIRCPNRPFGYWTQNPHYNASKQRFEYICAVPPP